MKHDFDALLPSLGGRYPFRARRAQFGMTQRELAKKSGVSRSTLQLLETEGRISVPILERIAPHLAMSLEEALIVLAFQTRSRRAELGEEP
jgi:transcriptional regulator with XRE-family HTH domain